MKDEEHWLNEYCLMRSPFDLSAEKNQQVFKEVCREIQEDARNSALEEADDACVRAIVCDYHFQIDADRKPLNLSGKIAVTAIKDAIRALKTKTEEKVVDAGAGSE